MRSYWLLIVAFVFCAAATAAGYVAWMPKPQPGLLARQPVHDFGRLPQGTLVTHEFTLVNNCGARIAISEVVKSCGCTNVACSQTSLEPDQETRVSVEFSTGRARGKTRVGLMVKFLLEDGSEFGTPLWLQADVLPDINYEPAQLEFDAEHTVRRVKFSPGQLPAFTIGRVTCMHAGFQAQLLPSGDEVEVRVIKPEIIAEGLPTTYLMAETSSQKEPACMIPLVVRSAAFAADDK